MMTDIAASTRGHNVERVAQNDSFGRRNQIGDAAGAQRRKQMRESNPRAQASEELASRRDRPRAAKGTHRFGHILAVLFLFAVFSRNSAALPRSRRPLRRVPTRRPDWRPRPHPRCRAAIRDRALAIFRISLVAPATTISASSRLCKMTAAASGERYVSSFSRQLHLSHSEPRRSGSLARQRRQSGRR